MTEGKVAQIQSHPRTVPSVSLVLPMFNEAAGVDHTLGTAVAALGAAFEDFEIVVADDGSTDGSAALVEAWAARDPRVRLVRLPRNLRFGGALRAGLAAATRECVVYTDFDLPVPLGVLPEILGSFDGRSVLTGYLPGNGKHLNWRQVPISWGYNTLVRSLFRLRLQDINFGFKVMPRAVLEAIRLSSNSPFVDAEIFVRAAARGFPPREVAVPFSQRLLGASHMRRPDIILATFADMLRLRLALWVRRPR